MIRHAGFADVFAVSIDDSLGRTPPSWDVPVHDLGGVIAPNSAVVNFTPPGFARPSPWWPMLSGGILPRVFKYNELPRLGLVCTYDLTSDRHGFVWKALDDTIYRWEHTSPPTTMTYTAAGVSTEKSAGRWQLLFVAMGGTRYDAILTTYHDGLSGSDIYSRESRFQVST
jgi:hypothetical protein